MVTERLPLADRTSAAARRFLCWCRHHPNATALGLYAIIALVANFPVYPGDPSRLNTSTTYDIAQSTWFLAYTPYAFAHGHSLFYTNIVNYPTGVNLAQNTGMPLLGLLTAPLTILVSPVASLNLLRWCAFFLSAYAAFWVFRRFVRWVPAACVGGLLYGFSPYMVTQGSLHLNLTFVPLPPLILYLLFEICVEQRQRAVRSGIFLGLLIVAQFYISAEVLATTTVVFGISLFYLFFLNIHDVTTRAMHAIRAGAVALCIILPSTFYPVWFMMHGRAHYTGPAQGFVNVFNADLLSPFIPTVAQLVTPRHLAEIGSNLVAGQGDLSENGSFLGIPLILFTIYLIARFWRRLWPLYFALVALTIFLFSLGPHLIVDGRLRHLPFNLPFEKLSHLPFLENLLPVRFSLYVVFFVAIIITLGLDWIHDDSERRNNTSISRAVVRNSLTGRFFGGAFALVTLISLLPSFPYSSFALRVNWSETKAGLKIIPSGSRLLTYPYPTVYEDAPMLWQALSGMRFNLFGSYALVPGANGLASLMPTNLSPASVQAMLEDSVTPTPVPGVPDIVATNEAIIAHSVASFRGTARFLIRPHAWTAVMTIDSVDTAHNTFIAWVKRLHPILVEVNPSTKFHDMGRGRPNIEGLVAGAHVLVTGTTTTGTVNTHSAQLLREFIRQNRVNDVVIDLGLRDSGVVAQWFRLALGPPTRAGAGGEVWLDALQLATRPIPAAVPTG
ncbi:MAG TPA: hypothetical protein VMU99_08145 [Acidimicrobiales bacterium]|nr:hypothetical protein [Acidimicrobiales bacterium]